MSDERKPPRRPRELLDDEVVEVSGPGRPPRPAREPFAKLVQTPAETVREVLAVQRKMSLQLDGFGQLINRRFDLFHEELALQRADIATIREIVTGNHAPRIDKVEATLGQKVAKRGSVVALVLVVAPLVAEALPKYRSVIETIAGLFQ
jgi:hypothetical protein